MEYKPVIVEFDVADLYDIDAVSMLVHDESENFPDVWFDYWMVDNDIHCDWNMYIFMDNNAYHQRVKDFQTNPDYENQRQQLYDITMDRYVEYAQSKGLI